MRTFVLCFLFRLFLSLSIRTTFSPDEYWQSIEPAHKIAFDQGHLTHEWTNKLRSVLYPSIFATIFQLLQLLKIDTPENVIRGPRVVGALIAALGDVGIYNYAKKLKGRRVAEVAVKRRQYLENTLIHLAII
jgi:phosphatidylinositol glycan class B